MFNNLIFLIKGSIPGVALPTLEKCVSQRNRVAILIKTAVERCELRFEYERTEKLDFVSSTI